MPLTFNVSPMEEQVGPFIRIASDKFPILPGEADELVNEGMYGKALAEYLIDKIRERGYESSGCCCEDWGWWIGLPGFSFLFGICIYGRKGDSCDLDLYVTDGAAQGRRWSWQKFRFIDNGAHSAATKLHRDLIAIFDADPEVRVLAIDLDSPFAD
ncbi:hypothetical protein KBZ20_14080 [Vulcanococcus limneticus Candia 3F8]|uniref:hypothetical protein n=2 Tax=Vulcanococcus limneticus TaxID=2170428 RepID=UPI0012FF8B7E|nr:hypothetical protein [Vulcanococcus limneticus]MCP9792879.1 hypothetical protein [Vulcanococcus limneticus MW73D5]MCP9894900.1 hypothetical protein [Vulcanococcus limneticus Candia 3F8]MCP9898345.1 hypothetical protein [Vulcanococcus limneticus Candia 3B3]